MKKIFLLAIILSSTIFAADPTPPADAPQANPVPPVVAPAPDKEVAPMAEEAPAEEVKPAEEAAPAPEAPVEEVKKE